MAKASPIEPYLSGSVRPDTHIVISQISDLPVSHSSMTEMLKTEYTAYLHLSVHGGEEYSIPVKYSYYVKPFLVLKSPDGEEENKNDWLSTIAFGEQNMDMGSTTTIYVKNPNNFAVQMSAVTSDAHYSVDEFNPTLEGQECKEIQVVLNSILPADESVEVPKSISFEGVLSISTDVPELKSATVALSGTLVDVIILCLISRSKKKWRSKI